MCVGAWNGVYVSVCVHVWRCMYVRVYTNTHIHDILIYIYTLMYIYVYYHMMKTNYQPSSLSCMYIYICV